MEKENRKRLQLGILITVGIILFIIGIFFIGTKQGMFKSTIKISTVFRDVNGLRKGDYVRYSGVRVGVVSSVTFVNDTSIKIEMNIEKKQAAFIHKDAIAYIASDGLVGNKLMNIKPGEEGSELIADNDIITSVAPYDMNAIFDKLLSTNNNIGTVTQQLAEITTKMNNGKGVLQSLMTDSSIADNFKLIINELKATGENAAAFSNSLNDISVKIKNGDGLLGTLISDTTQSGKLKGIISNLNSTGNYVESVSKNLSDLVQQSQQNGSTVTLLTKDTAFANSLKQSLINIELSSTKLNEDLEALKSNFLFRGYFRKQQKK